MYTRVYTYQDSQELKQPLAYPLIRHLGGHTMLMSKSQLQPVMIAAAAGGKMMATRMRTMSEPRTGILIVVQEANL